MIERWMEITKDEGIFDEIRIYIHSSGSIKIETIAKSDETISNVEPALWPISVGEVIHDEFDNPEDLKIALQNGIYKYSHEDAERIVNLVRDHWESLTFFKKVN